MNSISDLSISIFFCPHPLLGPIPLYLSSTFTDWMMYK